MFLAQGAYSEGEPAVRAFKALEHMAKINAIRIIDIRRRESLEKDESEVMIELRLQAKEEDFIRFIYGLKVSPLLFRITSFSFRPSSGLPVLESKFLVSCIPTF